MKSWKLILTTVLVFIWLAVIVCFRWNEIFCLLTINKFSLLFVGCALTLFASMVLFAQWVWEQYYDTYTTTWFRPYPRWKRSNEKEQKDQKKGDHTTLSWDDVENILSGDPLDDFGKFRGAHLGRVIYDGLKGVGMFLAISLFGYWAPALLTGNDMGLSHLSWPEDSGTFLIGAATVSVTLLIALKQHHAKVKSEKRQKWIDNVRDTLAKVIAEIPDPTYESPAVKPRSYSKKSYSVDVQEYRIKLELLLNPSEKDHRTLGWLLRKVYGISRVKPDKEIPTTGTFELIDSYDRDEWKQRNKIISYIIRLSNAILKREWERVKRGK